MKMVPVHILTIATLVLQSMAEGGGAASCPCLTNMSSAWHAISAQTKMLGYPVDYGLGCEAHDINVTRFGCSQNQGAHCWSRWCYVDSALCPINVTQCEATGAKVGSDHSVFCRERPMNPSHIVTNITVHYSYQTCGSLNTYDTSAIMGPVAGSVIKIAVDAWPPLVVKKSPNPATPHIDVYGGAVYDFMTGLMDSFEPKPTFQIVPGWSTQESRALFSSSYTACVHDVAVGHFDLCVAHLWLTSERAKMCDFLPSMKSDNFYLVVPKTFKKTTLGTMLEQPFKPFSPIAWVAIVAFLFLFSGAGWIVDHLQLGVQECRKKSCLTHFLEGLGECFDAVHDFVRGKSTGTPKDTAARKLVTFGYSFFLLVIASSYTANLATILMVEREAVGTIVDIQDAGTRGIQVCITDVFAPQISSRYKHVKFVEIQYEEHGARALYAGKCGAFVMSEITIAKLHAGNLKEMDCSSVADGSLSEEEGRCAIGLHGRKRNDCDLMKVGDLLMSAPVAMPVSSRLDKSLSWATTQQIDVGKMAESETLNAHNIPIPQCEKTDADDEAKNDGLPLDSVAGVIYIGTAFSGLGIAVVLCKLAMKSADIKKDQSGPSPANVEESERCVEETCRGVRREEQVDV